MDLVPARRAEPGGDRAGARGPRSRAFPRWAAVALALGLAAAAPACAHRQASGAGARRERFELPDGTALELGVPAGWKASFGEGGTPEGGAPAAPTVRLEGGREEFLALVTPFQQTDDDEEEAPPREPGSPGGSETAQALVELARRKALQTSAEKEIALEELRGDGVHGFWFSATDRTLAGKTPDKGEWRHLMQGAAAVGELIVAFTLLDNGPGPQRDAVLAMMRGARHLPEGAAAATPPAGAGKAPDGAPGRDGGKAGDGGKLRFEPDPAAATEPLAVGAPGHRWAVLVDLPRFQMMKPRPNEDGAGVLVLGQEPDTGLVASVSVRDGQGATDAAACRERTLDRLRRTAPDPKDLVRSDENGVARVRYRLDELRGKELPQHHAHAFLSRDGVCVDVHVSKVEPRPEDDARMVGILASVRFGDTL